jgi:S-methylmethionine-dependent homocysteine/selenocysteine methylase
MTGRTTILDGGMGRELLRMGAPFHQPEWSALALMEAPDRVAQAHGAFIAAGAEVITTNSYALVPFHIGDERFAGDGRRLAGLAGRLAREAADAAGGRVLVAGSLPPLFGSYRPDLFDAGRAPALLEALVEGLSPHIDLWLGETLGSLAEADAVRTALTGDARPLWISFTLADEGVDLFDPCLRSGEPVADAVQAALRMEAAALLFNCSQPEVMGPAVGSARRRLAELGAALTIGVYANTYFPKDVSARANEELTGDLRADLDPPRYLAFAKDWVGQGAEIVGGCCGIGPEHIAALRAAFP